MQCKVVDISITVEVKMRGKQLVWMFPHFFYLFIYSLSLILLPKRENKSETVLCVDDEALPWRVVVTALGTTRLYLSVFVQERETAAGAGSPQTEKRSPRWQVGHCWWGGRESTGEKFQEWWNIYKVIIYDVMMSAVTADFLFPGRFLWRIVF